MRNIASGENEEASRATIAARLINLLQDLEVSADKTMHCATFTNKTRAEFNKGMFLNYLENNHAAATKITIPSGVRSQESGVRSQESGVRSQESGVRSQESGVRSQESGAIVIKGNPTEIFRPK
jgi:hypothetical protein